ncbi:MAG: hypothetical protein LBT06_10715 [Hungatella sp.]|jgi:hypothetical protein|nr:hypothetical protein [Hungatella sp.]
MSARTDKGYAERYEADVKWYEGFKESEQFLDPPTEAQMRLIRAIETRSGKRFFGETKAAASLFIRDNK